jgi:hypothetical protein
MADAPGKMRYAVVEIDDVDYAEDAQTAELPAADTNVEVYKTLVPGGGFVDEDTPTHTFHLAGAQGTPLYSALVAAEGTVVDVVFQAEHGVGKTSAAFSMLVPTGSMPLGGQQGQFRAFDTTFTIQGDVVKTPSVA